MQIQKVHQPSAISRQAFKDLLALWLTIMFLTFAAALLMAAGTAKAAHLQIFSSIPVTVEKGDATPTPTHSSTASPIQGLSG